MTHVLADGNRRDGNQAQGCGVHLTGNDRREFLTQNAPDPACTIDALHNSPCAPLQRRSLFNRLVDLDLIARLDIVVVLNADTAFKA